MLFSKGRARALACAAAIGSALACKPPKTVSLISGDLSSEVAYLAILGYDGRENLTESTGLLRKKPESASYILERNAASGAFVVVGYSQRQLEVLGAPQSDEELFRARLREKQLEEPELPAPIFARRFDAHDPSRDEPASPPRLTVSWLPRCGRALSSTNGPLLVDVSCAATPCGASASEVACHLDIDLRGHPCKLERITGRFDGERALAITSPGGFRSCLVATSTARSPARVTLACTKESSERCLIDVYDGPPPAPIAVTASTSFPHEAASLPFASGIDRFPAGFITGITALQNRIAVSTSFRFTSYLSCDQDDPRDAVVFIDPAHMAQIGSKHAAKCLAQMIRDPSGAGFIGAFGGSEHRIGRFDENGDIVGQPAVIAHPRLEARARSSSMGIRTSPLSVFILYSEDGNDADPITGPPVLFALDPADFSVRASAEIPGVRPSATLLSVLADGTIAVSTDSASVRNTIYFYDGDLAGPRRSLPLRTACTNGMGVGETVLVQPRGGPRLLIGTSDPDSATAYTTPLGSLDRCPPIGFYPFFDGAAMFGVASWTSDQMLVAGLTEHSSKRAWLGFLDLERDRFLPAKLPIGIGPVAYFERDRDGRVWTALPWTSTLLRIEPQR
jgi:hypothetical protein